MKSLPTLVLTTLFACGLGRSGALIFGGPPAQEPSRSAAQQAPDPLAWIEGHWIGEGLGGTVEETWFSKQGGARVGLFRLVVDGNVVLYEIFTMVEGAAGPEMRLKHFHPDLKGWEPKDESLVWPLVSLEDRRVRFGPVEYAREGDTLRAWVEIEQGDETVNEELVYHLAP